jgi:hypothetical protein
VSESASVSGKHGPEFLPGRCYLPVKLHRPQSSSSSRLTASQAGFFDLSQSGERPERYGEFSTLLTMPSSPSLQVWRNTYRLPWAACDNIGPA